MTCLGRCETMAKVNWINGSIKPLKAKVYYVIMECVKDFGGLKTGLKEAVKRDSLRSA